MPTSTITTALASVPPIAVALSIALIGMVAARWRWSWPMVVDVGLLGLYVWRPGVGMLLFVLFLGSVRHVPALAREVVVLLRLHEFDGWTIRLVMVALPALRAYASDAPRSQQSALPPTVASATPVALPLLLGEGLAALNTDPTAPHVGVIGASRLGKTTFVGVVLSYRPGELVITTPKGEQYDPWFGATVVRTAMDMAKGLIDWSPIERAISGVHYEMLRRNTPSAGLAGPLTLVIDELTTTIAQIPAIAQKVIDIITMGAGSGVRLIAIATDVNVKGWRMDGRRDVLDNLVFAKVETGRAWSIGKLDANWRLIAPRALDTGLVQGLAARVSLAGRGWQAPAGDGGAGAGLLGGLLGVGAAGVPGVPVPGGGLEGPHTAQQTQTNKQTQTNDRVHLYMTWRAAGIKREQARLIRQGSGDGLDDAEWAEAGKRIAS